MIVTFPLVYTLVQNTFRTHKCEIYNTINNIFGTTFGTTHKIESLKFDPPAYIQRYAAVQNQLLQKDIREKIVKLVEFGCAELKFFYYVKNSTSIQEMLFVDIDEEILKFNANRIQPFSADYLKHRKNKLHIEILKGSIDCPESKLVSADAVICIEIIEHLYPNTLDAIPHSIFYVIEPRIAIFTTPNADFNVLFPDFAGIRHFDHKFEWTRAQFEDWANNVILRYPKYSVSFSGIGQGPAGTEHLGCCSQMAVFTKTANLPVDEARSRTIEEFQQINSIPSDPKIVLKYGKKFLDFLMKSFGSSAVLSHGVCSHESYMPSPDFTCVLKKFEVISEVDYPFVVDDRTEEQIICHESEYRLHQLSKFSLNEQTDRIEIPLYKLTERDGREIITTEELRQILEKAGWHIEECEVNNEICPCVIYDHKNLDSESDISERSQSPNNYIANVTNDSSSNWESDSTDDRDFPSMEKKWTESPSTDDSAHNTTCIDNTSPCSNNEEQDQIPSDKRVELLFDSGYQVSTSSVELSPELSKDWLQEERKDDVSKRKSETENIFMSKSEISCKKNDDFANASSMQSEGQLHRKKNDLMSNGSLKKEINDDLPNSSSKNQKERKRSKMKSVEEQQPQPIRIPIIQLPQEPPQVVENGDLANNNRDREGNNYQAAEHPPIIDDNARLPIVEDLDPGDARQPLIEDLGSDEDEYNARLPIIDLGSDDDNDNVNVNVNENPIVFQPILLEQIPDLDDEDARDIDSLSREVLFDPSSEVSLTDESYIIHGHHQPFIRLYPDDNSTHEFPDWLLEMLHPSQEEVSDDQAHFYSQGDGVGVHPSTLQIAGENSSTSSSSRESDPAMMTPTTAVETSSSTMDANFQDALDYVVNDNDS